MDKDGKCNADTVYFMQISSTGAWYTRACDRFIRPSWKKGEERSMQQFLTRNGWDFTREMTSDIGGN